QQFGFAYAPPLIISAALNNKVFEALQAGAKTVEKLKRNWLIGARLACNHGRACRLETAEKRSPIKIFSGAREPGVSYQQNNRRVGHHRSFWQQNRKVA